MSASVANPLVAGVLSDSPVPKIRLRLSWHRPRHDAGYRSATLDFWRGIQVRAHVPMKSQHVPDVEGGAKLSRWMPLVKWFLAIPLYLVGAFYSLIAVLLTIYAWLVTSISGKYPKGVSTWVFGSIRFWMRVQGYVVYLVTDEYPPFSLGI